MANKPKKYAHLDYQVLHDLEISIAEYWLLDMVYRLSRNGWCNKRLDTIAYDMRLTRRGVIVMRDRLIARKLLKKGTANRLATTKKVNLVYFSDPPASSESELSSKKVHSVHPESALSAPKNNYRLTKNKEDSSIDGPGKDFARQVAARVKAKV